MKTRRSLRKDIVIINSVVVAVILIMQFFHFAYLSGLMQKQKQNDVNNLLVQIDNRIEDCINNSKSMQNIAVSNNLIKDFLLAENSEEKDNYFTQLQKLVQEGNKTIPGTFNVIITDNAGINYYLLNEPTMQEKFEAFKLIPSEKNTKYEEDVQFFSVSNNPYEHIYVCSYAPVNIYNTGKVGMDVIGRITVINRFNTRQILYENGFFRGTRLCFESMESEDKIDVKLDFEESRNPILAQKHIRCTMWTVIAEVDSDAIRETDGINRQIIIIMLEIIIVALSMLVMILLLNKSIAKPAENISRFLDKYTLNGGGQRLGDMNTIEFNSISQHINLMLENMETMTRNIVANQQRLYEMEISENKAMIYALQSQINPHFLYNTLDCMASIALSCDQQDIYNITMGMSEILRYSLVEDIDVCIEDEIAITEKYLSIQKIRFRNNVNVDIDIEDEVWQVSIIRMCLQPIVENIFKYGMNPDTGNCEITIRGYCEDNNVKISIRDSGYGMDTEDYEELISKLSSDSGMYSSTGKNGLININRRLKFKYGNDYGLTINQKTGEFMEVIVTVPFNEREE